MRARPALGVTAALILATIPTAAQANQSHQQPQHQQQPQHPCPAGGTPQAITAEYGEEIGYVEDLELCVFENGSASVENSTTQVWSFEGPSEVDVWTGLDAIGGMHRLTERYDPDLDYMLPGERVALDQYAEMHWYLDPALTTRWMMFEQLVDAAEDRSTAAAAYLIGLKSKSGAALWTCTAGAASVGSTLKSDDEITGQDLIDASLTAGSTAESCADSWNALARKTKLTKARMPSLSTVTTFAEEASKLNQLNKLLRSLANLL